MPTITPEQLLAMGKDYGDRLDAHLLLHKRSNNDKDMTYVADTNQNGKLESLEQIIILAGNLQMNAREALKGDPEQKKTIEKYLSKDGKSIHREMKDEFGPYATKGVEPLTPEHLELLKATTQKVLNDAKKEQKSEVLEPRPIIRNALPKSKGAIEV